VDLGQRPLSLAGQLEGGTVVIREEGREGGREGGEGDEEEEDGGDEEEREEGEGRRANALIVWFELVMFPEEEEEEEGEGGREGGLTLSTGPGGVPSHCHWKQVVFYLPPSHPHARNLKAGERVRIAGAYDRDRLRVQVVGKEDG